MEPREMETGKLGVGMLGSWDMATGDCQLVALGNWGKCEWNTGSQRANAFKWATQNGPVM